jgi:hypothetical protein
MSNKLNPIHLDCIHNALRRTQRTRLRCISHIQETGASFQSRKLSTSVVCRDGQGELRSRWAHTPEQMRAPVSLNKNNPKNAWIVNEDPRKLDHFYRTFLGDGGEKMLTEEVKWLAVTHKSFDQGRRGYNDRLAFLGTLTKKAYPIFTNDCLQGNEL